MILAECLNYVYACHLYDILFTIGVLTVLFVLFIIFWRGWDGSDGIY